MELRSQIGHLKKNPNFLRPFKWLVLSLCSILLSLPFFGIASEVHAAFDYTYERTPAGDPVTNSIYGTFTVTDDSDCTNTPVKASLQVTRFGGGQNTGDLVPYALNTPFIVSVGGLALSSELDDPDGQYTGINLILYNEAEDQTCVKNGVESSSYPARLFTLIDGTTTAPELPTEPGGGSSTTEFISPALLDAAQTAALGIAFAVFILFGYIGFKASSRTV